MSAAKKTEGDPAPRDAEMHARLEKLKATLPEQSAPEKPPPAARKPGRHRRQTGKQIRDAFMASGELELVTGRMSEVERKDVRWLWPGRIPRGRLTFLLGRQGKGKSTLVCWLAAAVANGLPWPDTKEPNERGSVVIIQGEESASEDLKARFVAMGIDDTNIHIVYGCKRVGDDGESQFSLLRDVHLLGAYLESIGDVRLVIIDPISSFTHGINQRDDGEVRALLTPLKHLAEEHGATFLYVMHPSKNDEKDILDRAGNSAAFTQVPRIGWYYSDDPKDRSRRLLSPLKWNVRGTNKTAIAVSIKKDKLVWHPRPVYLDAFQVDRMLQKLDRDEKIHGVVRPDGAATLRAKEFIVKYLTEKGPSWVSVVLDQAEQVGLRESSFRKGLRRLVEDDGSVERWKEEGDSHLWIKVKPAAEPATPEPEASGAAGGATPEPPGEAG
jgi:archaellum biogenesis ATPase FlaH